MTWWRSGAIYEIYPRSFQDSDGDGIGDLRGIAARLPYVRALGVDAIWLTPIYPSPQRDLGYDITDHTAIDPVYGTLEDFDALVAAAHALGLRVLLDYVPNHTSDRHPWFSDPARRDWYIWRDGERPNNWVSVFGGSAWEYEPGSGRSYYHAYLREQPDLNWRNPQLREAMLGVLRFWLDRGVDGFRVDATRQLLKDPQWRDNPPNPDYEPGMPEYDSLLPLHTADLDEVQEVVAAIRHVIGDGLMIAEVYAPIERLVRYYGEDGRGAHLPFNLHLISTPWESEAIADLVERYEAALPDGAWPNWVLGNHDRSRVASRVGTEQARVAAMLLLTLRGTPTLYYGDEIGMTDVPVPRERAVDPGAGRDPARTPMRWSAEPYAGFSSAEPWLPVGDPAAANVSAQLDDPRSMLTLHRRLLALRRGELVAGAYRTLHAADGVLAYRRGERTAVALNLTGEPRPLPVRGSVVLSTHLDEAGGSMLRGHEGVLLNCQGC
jgi:alpha-glucosidase